VDGIQVKHLHGLRRGRLKVSRGNDRKRCCVVLRNVALTKCSVVISSRNTVFATMISARRQTKRHCGHPLNENAMCETITSKIEPVFKPESNAT
jgi:hypothetical protein